MNAYLGVIPYLTEELFSVLTEAFQINKGSIQALIFLGHSCHIAESPAIDVIHADDVGIGSE